jgi:hypothetical protein
MAAGQGFKTFTTGEVLTAADVNGYLMQGVGVFTDAANRDAEITSPQEGQFAYLKDTDVTTYYTGSAWANLDTTGMVNPMTTTGDTIYSSSGSTPARLGIGSTGQVLTVAGGVPTWATSASGSMTLLSTTTLSGATTTISSISQSYNSLMVVMYGVTAAGTGLMRIRPNSSAVLCTYINVSSATATMTTSAERAEEIRLGASNWDGTSANNGVTVIFDNYTSTTNYKPLTSYGYATVLSGERGAWNLSGAFHSNTAITSLQFSQAGGNLSAGTVLLYGVK